MIEMILAGIVGLFVGWNFPQPTYAVTAQAWVVAKWNSVFGKDEPETK